MTSWTTTPSRGRWAGRPGCASSSPRPTSAASVSSSTSCPTTCRCRPRRTSTSRSGICCARAATAGMPRGSTSTGRPVATPSSCRCSAPRWRTSWPTGSCPSHPTAVAVLTNGWCATSSTSCRCVPAPRACRWPGCWNSSGGGWRTGRPPISGSTTGASSTSRRSSRSASKTRRSSWPRPTRLLVELLRDGAIDGLRIDHPDGLADPARLPADARGRHRRRLGRRREDPRRRRTAARRLAGRRHHRLRRAAAHRRRLPRSAAGLDPLLATLAVLTGDARGPEEFAREAKMEVGLRVQAAEIARLVRLLGHVGEGRPDLADIRPETWRRRRVGTAGLDGPLPRLRRTPPSRPPTRPSQVLDGATERARGLLAASEVPGLERGA
jgi:hypothetical protein